MIDDVMYAETTDRLKKLGIKTRREYPDIERIRTGMVAFDNALGGGLPLNCVTEIWGPKSYGKTMTALIAAGYRAAQGDRVMYVNVEDTIDRRFGTALGATLGENVHVAEPDSGSEALNNILTILRHNDTLGFKLIILDSIAECTPDTDMLSDVDSRQIASRASMLTSFFRKVRPALRNSGCAVLGINQVRQTGVGKGVSYGDPYYAPGGEAKDHAMSIAIRMHAPEDKVLKNDNQVVAEYRVFAGKIKKNKTAPTVDESFHVSVVFKPSIYHWPANDLFETAVTLGVFQTASGETYSGRGTVMFEGTELGSSRDRARHTLGHDPALYQAVEKETYAKMESDSEDDDGQ